MKTRISLFFILLVFGISTAQVKPTQSWIDQKFSMFIHFGLYSEYGGVYDGKPVERGYSEQIQSFAGIFSDWYANTAKQFNPSKWNPDSIVALAKEAGMRSIVITSKHHDGFCLYHSKQTKYNIVDATPYKKDLMKELAEACERGGISFAVYFSLIDWNYPQAYPISSHNADPITPEHHQFNLKQVEEIMSNYGAISEIWFDMGSLTLQQSKELYNLVNRLQPQCMISGRLGNNYVDFSVMADNEYPEYKMNTPWQTAASMFDETWSYRSWQERGSVDKKVEEKLKSLIHVVSHGGNYLLNIGPKGDGSVVEFEREVLQKMGEWTKTNAEAIYASKANPLPYYADNFEVTSKDNSIYIFPFNLSDDILLSQIAGKVKKVSVLSTGQTVNFSQDSKKSQISIKLPTESPFRSELFPVIKVEFENEFSVIPMQILAQNTKLTPQNAEVSFAHSSLDYYCGYKSLTAYTWHINNKKRAISPKIYFTDLEKERTISLRVNDDLYNLKLQADKSILKTNKAKEVQWGKLYVQRGSGVFGALSYENKEKIELNSIANNSVQANEILNNNKRKTAFEWLQVSDFPYGEKLELDVSHRGSLVFMQEIEAANDTETAIEIGGGNGIYILLNGEYITAHCLPERAEYQKEIVILPLKKGENQLVIKYFNRFADKLYYSLKPLKEWTIHEVSLAKLGMKQGINQIQISDNNADSKVSPLRMNNIRIQ